MVTLREMSRDRVLVSRLAFVTVLIVGSITMVWNVDGSLADATADWLVASAAADGLDPYEDLSALAERYEVDYSEIGGNELGDVNRVHPRTPGTLLLLQPLSWLPVEAAYPVMALSAALALGLSVLLAFPRLTSVAMPEYFPLMGMLLVGTMAFLHTLEYGTHSAFLLILVIWGWLLGHDEDSAWGGGLIGIATVLRLFPALLFVPAVLTRKWRFALSGVGVALFLNLAGMVVLKIPFGDALQALTTASDIWLTFSGNGATARQLMELGVPSAAATVGPILAGGVLVVAVVPLSRGSWSASFAVAVIVMLLASPLSWDHYDVIAFAAAVWLLARPEARLLERLLVVTWGIIQLAGPLVNGMIAPEPATLFGLMAFLGRVLLLVSALLVVRRLHTDQREPVS